MIRAIAYFIVILALTAGVAWLADRPGELSLVWFGYEIRTAPVIGALALLVVLAIAGFLWWLLRAIFRSPQTIGSHMASRRRDKGYAAISSGLIAVGSGDTAQAIRASSEAQKLLAGEPLTQFLAAQTAQLRGDAAGARAAFEAMLTRPDTTLLGLHGLFVEARRQGAHEAARQFAERATTLKPGLNWAGGALLEYQSADGDWLGALRTLGANAKAKVVDNAKARRLRAVLTTAQAMAMESGTPEEARIHALEAHRLAPDLVPAAVIAARLATRTGDVRRATRIVEATWKLAPHPDLATAYAAARPGDSGEDRLKRMQKLANLQGGHREGKLALARAAIDARAWPQARQALTELTAEPTERVCLLMAEIEQGENGDRGRVRDWLARAVRAPRDPAWMADGEVFDAWAPVSPISGKLDAFEWKIPPARISGPVLAEIEALADALPETKAPPEQTNTVPLRRIEPAPARPVASPAPRSAPAPARPAAATVFSTRAPDDPGPDAGEGNGNGETRRAFRH